MAEVKITYQDPPEYPEIKTANLAPTYEKKSFKSYERPGVAPATAGTHIMTDDVDDGGGQSGTGEI